MAFNSSFRRCVTDHKTIDVEDGDNLSWRLHIFISIICTYVIDSSFELHCCDSCSVRFFNEVPFFFVENVVRKLLGHVVWTLASGTMFVGCLALMVIEILSSAGHGLLAFTLLAS